MLVSVITMYHDSLLALGLPVENHWQTTGLASLNTGQETILQRLGLPCSGCGDLLMEQLKIALMYSYLLLSVFEWPTQTTIGVLCYLSVSRRHQADSPDKWSSTAANSRCEFKSSDPSVQRTSIFSSNPSPFNFIDLCTKISTAAFSGWPQKKSPENQRRDRTF